MTPDHRIVIVGGCGRVGVPLGVAFALRGKHVTLYDRNWAAVEQVNTGRLPFVEPGTIEIGDTPGNLDATTEPGCVARADVVIVTIGTPIDEHLNPEPGVVLDTIRQLRPHLRGGQLLVLRSTLYPGTTAQVEGMLPPGGGHHIDIVCCPERIAEGRAMSELFELPQIIGAREPGSAERAADLFRTLASSVVIVTPEEAEYAKLFTNAWRYTRFAIANQLWSIATDAGLDYDRIRHAITHGYPRAADLPSAGFAAGPCLLKDTLQLAALPGGFPLGHAAMQVNEGLPMQIVDRLDRRYGVAAMVVGILGMAFKGDSDDTRDSLAYKLRKILTHRALDVLCTDHRVDDRTLLTLDEVLQQADVLIIAAPHTEYRDLKTDLPVVDVWGITGQGIRL